MQEFTPTETEGWVEQRFVGGGTRNVNNFVLGPTDVTARLVFNPQNFELMAYALGLNTDGAGSQVVAHTMSELNSTGTFPSFAIEEAKGLPTIESRTYRGIIVNTAELSGRQGEPLTVSMDLVAQSGSAGTSITAVTSGTKVPYMWSDTLLNISGAALNLTGFLDETTEFTWSLNNNLTNFHYVNGSRVIGKPIPTNRDYEATVTLHMTDVTGGRLWDIARNGSSFNFDIQIRRTGASTASGNDFWLFWNSGCQMYEASYPNPPEGAIEQRLVIRPTNAGISGTDVIGSYATFF